MDNNIDNLNKTSVEIIDKIVQKLVETPIFGIREIADWTGYTDRGAYNVIEKMVALGLVLPYGNDTYGQKWISRDYQVELESEANKISDKTINLVNVGYAQDGTSTNTDSLGMREMQRRVYEQRNSKKLLIKAPPASGKSRALMFVALDKLHNQGIRKVIIAVPERVIGSSFADTDLTANGFYWDWEIADRNNLCADDGLDDRSKTLAFRRFMDGDDQVLLCTHATLRFAFEEIPAEMFNDCVLAIDEFHHASTSNDSRLGQLLHEVMNGSNCQIIAMTGSYFRGDAVPILTPEDEEDFDKVTYTYYEQLNGYTYLKTLGIGYHFYNGRFYEDNALADVLDSRKKTIVYIPNVNSKESTKEKLVEVQRIYDILGEWIETDDNKVDYIRTPDGRVLRVANLVDDDEYHRRPLVDYLTKVARNDISGIDIIVALGMAKEGFDWPYCEHTLTIGYRSSLTEIVQIIGRCTRDSYNKTHTQFTNLIAQPNGTNDEITVAVNDMLKAITVSLLMEQVLAPVFKFTPTPPEKRPPKPGEVFVKGLKRINTERVKRIVEEDLEDLTAALLQNPKMQKAAAKGLTGEYVKNLQRGIIREKHPGLTEEEVEVTRQYLAANLASKTAEPVKDKNGNVKFLRMSNRFVKIDELDINLIDSINPFQRAFEILSKKIDPDMFRKIRDVIDGAFIDMDLEQAFALYPQIKTFVEVNGRNPDRSSRDQNEQLLAKAQAVLTNEYARRRALKAQEAQNG